MKKRLLLFGILFILGNSLIYSQWSYSVFGGNTPLSFAVDSTGQKMYIVYVYGGYFMSHDAGENWTPINSLITSSETVLPDFVTVTGPGNQIATAKYLGIDTFEFNNTIKYSTQNGWGWQRCNILDYWPDNTFIGVLDFQMIVAPDNENLWYCWNLSGFGHSIDGGQTWTVTCMTDYTNNSTSNCYLDPEDSSTIYLTCLKKVLRSTDCGQSWEILDELIGDEYADMFIYNLAKLDNGDLLVVTMQYNDPVSGEWTYFRKSSDNGETWEWMDISGLPNYYTAYKVYTFSDVPGLLYVYGYGRPGLHRSTDYGNTWSRVESLFGYPLWGELPFYDRYNNKFYYTANGYGLFVSGDYGYTWEEVNTPDFGPYAGSITTMVVNPNGLSFMGEGCRLWSTEGNGTEFHEETFEMYVDTLRSVVPCKLDSEDLDIRLMTAENVVDNNSVNYLVTSEDGGNIWNRREIDLGEHPMALGHIEAMREHGELNLIVYKNQDTGYFTSSDTGRTWNRVDLGFHHVLLNVYDNIIITTNTSQNVFYVSEDYGQSWENWGNPDPTCQISYDWKIYYQGKLFVRHNGYCYKKEGSDSPWIRRGLVFDGAEETASWEYGWDLVTSPSDTFIVAGSTITSGLYISDDWGDHWQRRDLRMDWATQSRFVNKVAYDKYRDRLWIDTGAGLAYLNGPSLGVEGRLELIPATYETLHTYPNPFNSSTKITFTLIQPGKVSVQVYDILGRKVADLFDDYATIGSHTVLFDGDGLATGSYFVHFKQDGNTTTRKITMVK